MHVAECFVSLGLGPPATPITAQGAPHSAVLLWQTSLGGTVRQCLCPCQGKGISSLPPCQFLVAGSAAVHAGFPGMLLQTAAAALLSDILFPITHLGKNSTCSSRK